MSWFWYCSILKEGSSVKDICDLSIFSLQFPVNYFKTSCFFKKNSMTTKHIKKKTITNTRNTW